MKLSVLLEVQRCYDMLREAEVAGKPLLRSDYTACLNVCVELKIALQEITSKIEVEVIA